MELFFRWVGWFGILVGLAWLGYFLRLTLSHRKQKTSTTPHLPDTSPLSFPQTRHQGDRSLVHAYPHALSSLSPVSAAHSLHPLPILAEEQISVALAQDVPQESWKKLAAIEEEVLHRLQEQGISIPLMLASLAAEREILPFYSLCGVVFIDAIPRRLYHLNREYQAVLLSDIVNVPDSPVYTHVLAIYQHEGTPVLTITAEQNVGADSVLFTADTHAGVDVGSHAANPPSLSWGQLLWNEEGSSHLLRMFMGEQQSQYGTSDRWANLDAFVHRALHIAIRTLSINTPPLLMDDGSTSRFVAPITWDDETWKDLIYCLEVFGMYMMVRIAWIQDVSPEELEYTFLHRYRIDICLRTFSKKAPLPLQMGLKLLLDLHVFAQQIQEELEVRQLCYLEIVRPLSPQQNSFVSYLSDHDLLQRVEQFHDNHLLLDCLHDLIATVEKNLNLQQFDPNSRPTPHFDA